MTVSSSETKTAVRFAVEQYSLTATKRNQSLCLMTEKFTDYATARTCTGSQTAIGQGPIAGLLKQVAAQAAAG